MKYRVVETTDPELPFVVQGRLPWDWEWCRQEAFKYRLDAIRHAEELVGADKADRAMDRLQRMANRANKRIIRKVWP